MAKKKIDGIKFNMFDERLMDFLGKFHCSDKENIKKYCREGNRSISDKRLKMFLDKGYIQKDKIKIQGKVIEVYDLNAKGKRYIKGSYRKTTSKAYKSTSKRHDYMHMKSIMSEYEPEEIRKFYKSEYELDKGRNCDESRTDGAFIYDDGRQSVYVETVTQYYKDSIKLAKERYAISRNGQYKPINVKI